MQKSIPRRYILTTVVIASVLNAAGILLGSTASVIIGLILAILQVNIIGTLRDKQTPYLILGTIMNTGLSSLLVIAYCANRANPACERNPVILSILPGALLAVVWLPTLLVAAMGRLRGERQ